MGLRACPGSNRKSRRKPTTCCWRPCDQTLSPPSGQSVCQSVASGSRASRSCEKTTGLMSSPRRTLPLSVASSPISKRSNVVLPTPLPPVIATRSPRATRSEAPSITWREPKRLAIPSASTTILAPGSAVARLSGAVPCGRWAMRRRRSSRSALSLRSRPWLRVRRAVTPLRSHSFSASSFLPSRFSACSSSAKILSRQSSKRAKSCSAIRSVPRSSQAVRVPTSLSSARSWLIKTTAPG